MAAIALTLIQNVALIVLLATVQQYVLRMWERHDLLKRAISGLLYGGVGIVAMMTSFELQPGLIFDGRSIILSVAGMFGGPVVAALAAAMCGLYRYLVGGVGAAAGVTVIVESALLGVGYFYLRRWRPSVMRALPLLGFGVIVHVMMLATQLTLPGGIGPDAVERIWLPVMALFPLGTLLVARFLLDQEERLEAQEKLARDEERLRLALEAANQGLYDLDVRTGIATVSPEYATLLGYDPDTFRETNEAWIERLHPDDREPVAKVYRDYVAGALQEYRVEFRQRMASGEWKWILSLGRIMERDENGEPVRMFGTHTDISEIKAVEEELHLYQDHLEELVERRTEELARINAELKAATKAKDAFLAAMSHELRTPLNSIIGFSGILSQGLSGPLTDKQCGQVDIIHAAGKHLLALIEDVLDLSKIEAGKDEVRIEALEPVSLVRETAEIVRPLAEDKGLELRVVAGEDDRPLMTDCGKVRQILLNLLGNAIKFTDSGWVEVRLERDAGGGAVFSVGDSGPGIAPADRSRVFEAFTQVDVPNESKPKGTGLGLALSRKYAHMIGGELDVNSRVGVGSTFILTVPAALRPARRAPEPPPSSQL